MLSPVSRPYHHTVTSLPRRHQPSASVPFNPLHRYSFDTCSTRRPKKPNPALYGEGNEKFSCKPETWIPSAASFPRLDTQNYTIQQQSLPTDTSVGTYINSTHTHTSVDTATHHHPLLHDVRAICPAGMICANLSRRH